jgi:hypothetical protein
MGYHLKQRARLLPQRMKTEKSRLLHKAQNCEKMADRYDVAHGLRTHKVVVQKLIMRKELIDGMERWIMGNARRIQEGGEPSHLIKPIAGANSTYDLLTAAYLGDGRQSESQAQKPKREPQKTRPVKKRKREELSRGGQEQTSCKRRSSAPYTQVHKLGPPKPLDLPRRTLANGVPERERNIVTLSPQMEGESYPSSRLRSRGQQSKPLEVSTPKQLRELDRIYSPFFLSRTRNFSNS